MFRVRFYVFGSVAVGLLLLCSAAGTAAGGPSLARPQAPLDAPLLVRVGEYVERYYERAQSLLAQEEVTVQPLSRDLGFDGFARRLVYELRLEWDPAAAEDQGATVVRDLISVNGRAPRDADESRCTDPRSISPEPLAALLPAQRGKYIFHPAGTGNVGERDAATFEFRSIRAEPPRVTWKDDCASIDLPGRTRGRVWVDPATAEVLRFDEHLTGMVDIPVPAAQQRRGASPYMTVERADTSIHYAPVTFVDPDETLMLPSRIESVVVVRNSGSPRLRITQSFSRYRRFVTESRIVR